MSADPLHAWNQELLRDPHAVADKRDRVRQMFAAIAPSYDLNNRLHSFWRDQSWRRRAAKLAALKPGDTVIDVACGTGDLTLEMFRALPPEPGSTAPAPGQVIGIDFTYEMLPLARRKCRKLTQNDAITFLNADATCLPLPEACADVVCIAFGIRNVDQPERALREFRRVLRPGGRVIVLEFSEPANPVLRALNRFYCGRIMPFTATLISRDRSGAYHYLPRSIGTFWAREKMAAMLAEAGFVDITQQPMTFGVCVCYRGFVDG